MDDLKFVMNKTVTLSFHKQVFHFNVKNSLKYVKITKELPVINFNELLIYSVKSNIHYFINLLNS
jgi:hypothetical protein